MSGLDPFNSTQNHRIIRSSDGKLALWVGVIYLWKLGKPVGSGGPLHNSLVEADVPSDPYLIGFYDNRTVHLSHDYAEPVNFTIEVNVIGHGPWMQYAELAVPAGEVVYHDFPTDFEARWVRIVTDKNCEATAYFVYR